MATWTPSPNLLVILALSLAAITVIVSSGLTAWMGILFLRMSRQQALTRAMDSADERDRILAIRALASQLPRPPSSPSGPTREPAVPSPTVGVKLSGSL